MRRDAVHRMRVPRKTLAAIKRVAAAKGEGTPPSGGAPSSRPSCAASWPRYRV